jgi:hypothetical protein
MRTITRVEYGADVDLCAVSNALPRGQTEEEVQAMHAMAAGLTLVPRRSLPARTVRIWFDNRAYEDRAT